MAEINGAYDLTLEWTFRRRGDDDKVGDEAWCTIFDALSELGLKLEAPKVSHARYLHRPR